MRHHLHWTQSKIEKYWEHFSPSPSNRFFYFSYQKRKSLFNLIKKQISFDESVYDVGCGPGFFVQYLASKGIRCSGTDLSAVSVAATNSKCLGMHNFEKAVVMQSLTKIPLPDNSKSVVFALETIEHIFPEIREKFLFELTRITKPCGFVCLTTPYNEDLNATTIICPHCSAEFHRWQHLDSFNEEKIAKITQQSGFETIFCKAVRLPSDFSSWLMMAIKSSSLESLCPDCETVFIPDPQSTSILRKLKKTLTSKTLVWIGIKRAHL